MGRQIGFNREETLRKILFLFWDHGYANTSLETICKKTKLTKPSLYNSFGNKEELFLACLKNYKEQMEEHLNSYPKGIDFIYKFFSNLIKESKGQSNNNRPKSCFIMNSFSEFMSHAPSDLKKILTNESWEMLEQFFKKSIKIAKKDGDLSKDANTSHLAKWLITQVYAFRGWSSEQNHKYSDEIYAQVIREMKRYEITKTKP